jgi:hypothetical protein
MARTPRDEFHCVLRASWRAPRLGPLLKAFRGVKPTSAWRAGTTDPSGRKRRSSGFTLGLAEGADWRSVAVKLRRRLETLAPMIREARAMGAELELAVSVALAGRRGHAVRFEPTDLAVLAGGVELVVEVAVPEVSAPRGRRTG